MKLSSCVTALFMSMVTFGCVNAKTPEEYEREFKTYLRDHHLTFDDALVYAQRLENYISNDLFILAHNELTSTSFTLGHNEYSHLSFNEFSNVKKGFVMPPNYLTDRMTHSNSTQLTKDDLDVPASIDWVTKGGVTPVKNQGQCGSCWAFSTTGAVEGAVFVASGKLRSLSEQELVDCDHDGDQGCNGGLMDHAFHWIDEHGGICTEDEYVYHGAVETCQTTCKSVVKVTGFTDIEASNEQALKAAVAQQPVSVAIEADQREFQFYKSGVFDLKCGTQLDHGVLVVGYGDEDGKKFWKVKNSWGPTWGKEGYILLAREMGVAAGQCGVAMVPSYPTAALASEALADSEAEEEQAMREMQREAMEQYLLNLEPVLPIMSELEQDEVLYGDNNSGVYQYFPDSDD